MSAIILNFHGIGHPNDGVPDDERPYWITQSFFEDVLALALAHPRRKNIVFTFDDGNVSDRSVAAPALKEAGFIGWFFLLTGRFGQDHYLSPDDAIALQGLGMHIGLHGRDHVDWTTLSDLDLGAETAGARADLERHLRSPVDTVAVPFGRYDARVIRRLRLEGFRTIFTSDGGRARENAAIQNRTSVRADMSIGRVRDILDGREAVSRAAKRRVSTLLRRHIV